MEDSTPQAPPVVAVVIAHRPGPWFDEVLIALAAQEYPNLRILVLDSADDPDLARRIAPHLPGAFVRSLPGAPGFGAAANEAMRLVEGAGFFCFLHDDVALAPDAIRLLVEETYRSNAGITGPKLLTWSDPTRIDAVGLELDKFGEVTSVAEAGELDQEQHDAVRDVFAVSSACLLVRTDLFRELGGFDTGIDGPGDDVDLCWRAHVSGARVLVVPAATARHRRAHLERSPVPPPPALVERNRMRSLLGNYTLPTLAIVLLQYAVVWLVSVVAALVTARFSRAAALVSSWAQSPGDLLAKRRAVKRVRRVHDTEVRNLQVRGSARFTAFVRGRTAREDRFASLAGAGRSAVGVVRAEVGKATVLTWLAVLVLFLLGSRHVIGDGVPTVGSLLPFPAEGSLWLVRSYLSGWWGHALGAAIPVPVGAPLAGLTGIAGLGFTGLVRTILTIGPLMVGYLGAWRLVRPFGPVRARIGAVVLYAAVPLPYNALAEGRWAGVVAYGAMPFVLARLARLTRLAPFGPEGGAAGPGVPVRHRAGEVAALALLVALTTAFVPAFWLVVVLTAVALAVGSLLVGGARAAALGLVWALAAAAGALVLLAPWSAGLFDADTLGSLPLATPEARGLSTLLRFETGPHGGSALVLGLWVAAGVSLVLGRAWRLAWAGRALVVVIAFGALAVLGDRGSLPFTLPAIEVVLVPIAAALALAVGCTAAAFEVDVRGSRFSWRQPLAFGAAVALALSTLPMVLATADGRWDLPDDDFATSWSLLPAAPEGAEQRVLWVGDPRVLPGAPWSLEDGLAYAVAGYPLPDLRDLWAGTPGSGGEAIGRALTLAADGGTRRLGNLLGPAGIRWVAVPSRPAPAATDAALAPPPAGLLDGLARQLDLQRVEIDDALVVYENLAWLPVRAQLSASAAEAAQGDGTDLAGADLTGSTPVLGDEGGPNRTSGDVAAGIVGLAAEADAGWVLTVDGERAERSTAFGWANAFAVPAAGDAALGYDTSASRYLVVAGQSLLWLVALVLALGGPTFLGRRGRIGRRPRPATTGTEVLIDLESSPVEAPAGRTADADTTAVPIGPPLAKPISPDPLLGTSEEDR